MKLWSWSDDSILSIEAGRTAQMFALFPALLVAKANHFGSSRLTVKK